MALSQPKNFLLKQPVQVSIFHLLNGAGFNISPFEKAKDGLLEIKNGQSEPNFNAYSDSIS